MGPIKVIMECEAMTMTPLEIQEKKELLPRITVIGAGGAGGNAVNNMIRGELKGVKFIASNTDAQALTSSLAEVKIQLGYEVTQGLGAGSHPEIGKASAEESIEEVIKHIESSNMLFITAGMGGGTGTGSAPVIAKAARDKGILTIGVVTKPFHFEGVNRMRTAEQGIEELQQYVDTLIIIPNQNLFRVANEKTTFADAFKMADDVLYSGVRSITDLMMKPGLINLDFADVRAVMGNMMGKAMMGTGEAQGEGRAIESAEAAISSPLLDDVSMRGAKAVLINITGGLDMTLYEVDEAANRIREEVDPEAHIIFGSTFDESLEGTIRVSCVATGIDAQAASNFNKARVSEIEREVQEAVIQIDEETIAENFDQEEAPKEEDESDAFIRIIENESISPYSLGPDDSFVEDTYNQPQQTPQPEEKPLGFFDRLIGRKINPLRQQKPPQRPRPQQAQTETPQSQNHDEEFESLEIPAFLRRQQNR